MKPFILNEYLANPSLKVVTRDGRPVRILCTDAKSDYPVIGLISSNGGDYPENYTENGTYLNNYESDNDLFFGTVKKDGWVSVYRNVRGNIFFSSPYRTKEEALEALYDDTDTRIDTIKVESEE